MYPPPHMNGPRHIAPRVCSLTRICSLTSEWTSALPCSPPDQQVAPVFDTTPHARGGGGGGSVTVAKRGGGGGGGGAPPPGSGDEVSADEHIHSASVSSYVCQARVDVCVCVCVCVFVCVFMCLPHFIIYFFFFSFLFLFLFLSGKTGATSEECYYLSSHTACRR